MKKLLTWTMALAAITCLAVMSAQAEDEPGTALNAGLSLTDGNSDTLSVNVGLDHLVGGEDDADQFSAGAEWNYGEVSEEETVQNAGAYAGWKHVLTDAAYAYVRGTIFHDDIADIGYRLTLGPGVGSVLWSDDAAELGVEIGAAWVREEAKATLADLSKVDVEDDSAALRLAQYYTRDLSDTAKVWQGVEYLPDFDDFGNYLLNAEIGIEAAINDSTSLRIVAKDRFDSEADDRGREDNDVQVLAGLSYKL